MKLISYKWRGSPKEDWKYERHLTGDLVGWLLENESFGDEYVILSAIYITDVEAERLKQNGL